MTFTRAITISLLLHGAFLGYAFLQFDPMADELAAMRSTPVVVDFAQVEATPPPVTREEKPDEYDDSELASMDLAKGLDGEPDSEPEPAPEPPPEQPAEAEPEPEEPAEPESSEKPDEKPTPSEPDSPAPADKPTQSEPEKPPKAPVATSEQSEERADSRAEPNQQAELESVASKSASSDGRSSAEGSGSVDGEGSGATGGSESRSSGRSGIDRGALIRGYTRKLYRRIAHAKYYPRSARRAGVEGTVGIGITIDEKGRILSVELEESSGYDVLDRAALDAVRSLEKLPPPPAALAWSRKQLRVPIQYHLNKRG